MSTARTISRLGVVLILSFGGVAFAQSAARAELQGKIDRFTLAPSGTPDGFILDDGIEVRFQRYLGGQLARALNRGELVKVQGVHLVAQHLLLASSVTDLVNHQTVVDRGEAGLQPQAGPSGSVGSAEGEVRVVLHNFQGVPDGAILDSGMTIRLPEDVPAILPTLLAVGQTLAVRGEEIDTENGPLLRVESMGPSANELNPLQQPSVLQP
jgi:hypothetical protein